MMPFDHGPDPVANPIMTRRAAAKEVRLTPSEVQWIRRRCELTHWAVGAMCVCWSLAAVTAWLAVFANVARNQYSSGLLINALAPLATVWGAYFYANRRRAGYERLATFDEERRDPRFPRCPTHAWFEVALPTDPASLWADVWGRRLLAVAALTGVLTALILLAFRGLAAQPGLWLAMLCIPAAAACQWFSYDAPFSSSFRFGYAAEYAENILKYAKRPLDLPQYLADLDPWTSQPADGTLSAWRLEVDRRGLPGMSDAEIVHNLLAACEQPGSPYRQWWTDFVLPHRQKAESRDGEVRTCSICRGRGGKISIDKCYSCNGTGVHAKPYRRLINFVTVPIARDVSVVHRTYETGCEYTQCKTCNGTGKTSSTYQCDDCSSTGTVKYSAQDVYAVDSRALVAAEARREFGGGTGEVVQAGGEEAVAGLPSFALVCAMVATFVMLATCSAPEPNADASPSQPTVQGRQ